MSPPAWILALVVGPGGIDVEVTAHDLDAPAIESGVQTRLGQGADGWHVDVQPGLTDSGVHIEAKSEDGRIAERDVELESVDRVGRSRELASMITLLIEEANAEADPPEPDPPPDPDPPPPDPPPSVTGWIAAMGRVGLNPSSSVDADPGAGLAGGVWLDRVHLQPVVQVGWGKTSRDDVALDGIRFGGGLMAGATVADGRVWAGGGVVAHAIWARAAAQERATGWGSVTELSGLVQYRGRWWILGARVGVDLFGPALRAIGDSATVHWATLRPAAALLVGVRLPPAPKTSSRLR